VRVLELKQRRCQAVTAPRRRAAPANAARGAQSVKSPCVSSLTSQWRRSPLFWPAFSLRRRRSGIRN
jgi:hypothetical protein